MQLRCESIANNRIKIVKDDQNSIWHISVDGVIICSCYGIEAGSCAVMIAKGFEEGSMPSSSITRFQTPVKIRQPCAVSKFNRVALGPSPSLRKEKS